MNRLAKKGKLTFKTGIGREFIQFLTGFKGKFGWGDQRDVFAGSQFAAGQGPKITKEFQGMPF